MQRLSRWFADLRLRYKLLVAYGLAFTLIFAALGGVMYSLVRGVLTDHLRTELTLANDVLCDLVRTNAAASMRNHLRAIAETNRDVAAHFQTLESAGQLSRAAAQAQAAAVMLDQRIGTTGYLYCIDTSGDVRVHPVDELLGTSVAEYPFIQEQIARREGYLEYEWRNPGEDRARPKALYMAYFEPWDWIVSASSYRAEFLDLVNVADLRAVVLTPRIGTSGYACVLDGQGRVVIHPGQDDFSAATLNASVAPVARAMLAQRKGLFRYQWQAPGEEVAREKVACLGYLPEFDWLVVSTAYVDEFYAPLQRVRRIFLAIFLLGVLLILPVSGYLSAKIARPLRELTEHFRSGTAGCSDRRVQIRQDDEVGQLAAYFNAFMDRLDDYHGRLRAGIEEREALVADLRHKNEELEDIIHVCSHDLRSPLINIDGFSKELGYACARLQELLPRDGDHDQLVELVEKDIPYTTAHIAASVSKMDRLQKGLLQISRLGRSRLQFEPVDMDALLAQLVQAMRFQIQQAAAEVVVHELPACKGDLVQLSQVFANLLDNALKYLDPGRSARIEVSGKTDNGQSAYVVSDNGIGIADNLQERIFEPFHRLDPQSDSGEGLGLTLVRRIVHRHHGRVWVESTVGRGSRFWVTLPAV